MIYVLGERPGPNTDPDSPLDPEGSMSGKRLSQLLGLTPEEYLERTVRVNANPDHHGSTASRGARDRAANHLEASAYRPFLVLGKQALRAMPERFRSMEIGDVRENVLLLPHTSGVCRVWNDKEYMAALGEFARAFVSV